MVEWNLASDPRYEPHTPGDCTKCLGAVTIEGDKVTRNPAYFVVAHASKFVRPGSVRVSTSEPPSQPDVAFEAPGGRTVLIVLNDGRTSRAFAIREGARLTTTSLPAGAVATFVWR